MKYSVHLTAEAEGDLLDIYHYVSLNDSPKKAEDLLAQLEGSCQQLENNPRRGHVTPELERIDVLDYREVHCHSFKIIYEIISKKVYVHCVLDGRRDLQEILQMRLLR